MLDARDAMLAADRMRFDGDDQKVMWDAFAKRGMGKGASTPNADSGDVTPSFSSPTSQRTPGSPWPPPSGSLYVGRYEARVDPGRRHPRGHQGRRGLLAGPGHATRWCTSRAGRGFQRFTLTVKAGQRKTLRLTGAEEPGRPRATAPRSSPPATGSLNVDALIDGTEATNWAGVNDGTNVDETGQNPFVVGRPRGRRADRAPGPGQRDAAPGAGRDPSDVPLAARPGLGLAVHRAAPVRARGLHQQAATARTRPGSASTPPRPTPSRAPGRGRWPRT